MSHPGKPPPSDRTPLEPWALEIEASEPNGGDPATREELEQVVSLLRRLPDPELPEQLSESILARVAEDAARPRIFRANFGISGRAALALAAGVAGLLVLSVGPEQIGSWSLGPQSAEPDHVVIRVPENAARRIAASGGVPRAMTARQAAQPQLVSLLAPAPLTGFGDPIPAVSSWDRQLDHQLNQLQLDPHAFAERLELVTRRDDMISRLARRAGERGDAPEIAMQVRTSDHPLADQIVNRMLRAALVENVSPR